MFKFYHEEVLQSHQQIYICTAYAILEFVDDSVTKARFDSLFPVIQDICLHNTWSNCTKNHRLHCSKEKFSDSVAADGEKTFKRTKRENSSY